MFYHRWFCFFVGMTRFELATPRPPDVCATGLRHIPMYYRCMLYSADYILIHHLLQVGRKCKSFL
jgi:hypothetical protein